MADRTRLYYEDPYLTEFAARVVERRTWEGRPAVVLDRTAFYPTSGGQPHDTGRLNGARVVAVEEDLEGRVVHVLDRPLEAEEVRGQVDWARRFDHMQQHTGQHILSQACWQVLRAETVGFHLGDEVSTIDLDVAGLDFGALEQAEALANEVVFQDRPVRAAFFPEAEAASLPLRKPPAVQGEVRVVQVEGFDYSACGGTHVRRTGEVGPITVVRVEHRGRESRVHFVCGHRATRDHRQRVRITSALLAALTVGLAELPDAVARLQEDLRTARKEARDLRERVLDAETEALLATAPQVGAWKVVRHLLPEGEAATLKWMAQRLTARPGVVALLALGGDRGQLAFACSEDVPLDMAALLREVARAVGGGGGGGPRLAQGGGFAGARAAEALDLAWERLGQAGPLGNPTRRDA
ncbi:MAG: alanyl-tRNA editing protein [Anaerolineae bacterium]